MSLKISELLVFMGKQASGVLILSLLVGLGCNSSSTATTTPKLENPALEPEDAPLEPAQVELSDATTRIDDEGNFHFKVRYRFTKGRARQHYLLTVNFPGTANLCLKHMESYELPKLEGVIQDGIPLFEQPIKSWEITFSEADSPMNEYKLISNVLTGTVP